VPAARSRDTRWWRSVQPGPQRRPALEAGQAAPRLQQSLLMSTFARRPGSGSISPLGAAGLDCVAQIVMPGLWVFTYRAAYRFLYGA
jgi:hypothetical protein